MLHHYFAIIATLGLLSTSCTTDKSSYTPIEDITIYRDQWGVPHIYAPTDEQVAYGLAWAQCEDDFKTVQEQMLAIQGKLGEVKGKDGIMIDFAIHFMGIREKAQADFYTLSPKVQNILTAFVSGINAYAATHPEIVLLADAFPISRYDAAAGSLLGLVEISGASSDLKKIMDLSISNDESANFPKGSNAIALSSKKTDSHETFLAINSHQPLEGWYSWYEAHLISDEGENILGGTFPGGATIFHGTNEYLGWAHTVNHADFSDVYKLTMHPEDKLSYLVDGQYKTLVEKEYRSWLKLWGPVKIPITKTVYKSDFGVTFKTDKGFYAWRFAAADAIRSIEQWYRMNRATSWQAFRSALDMQAIPCTNIVYADREDNIFYISNGRIPKRTPQYDWQEVLPADQSNLKWDHGYWPIDSLPQVLNPACGYVFNTNNSPFVCTSINDRPAYFSRYQTMGFLPPQLNNNRSTRLLELLEKDSSLSYNEFKAIKYDRQYPRHMTQPHMVNQELLLHIDPIQYPDISDAILILKKWNRRTDPDNEQALLYLITVQQLNNILIEDNLKTRGTLITEAQGVQAISQAKSILLEHYNTLELPLGNIQRHIRGRVDLPVGGGPDVLAAIYSVPIDKHRYRAQTGESYIQLVRFAKDSLPIIETINAYGSSANPDDPHSTDQMKHYVNQKLKPMTLSLQDVKSEAVNVYHPLGEINQL